MTKPSRSGTPDGTTAQRVLLAYVFQSTTIVDQHIGVVLKSPSTLLISSTAIFRTNALPCSLLMLYLEETLS